MVDIARPSQARKKRIRRILIGGGLLAAIVLITVGVSRLKPAAPSVDRATVWIDTVKRGPMLRQVRGSGTLVPEEIRWIPATTQGRVERIVLRPGATVKPDTVILELSNPDLQQSVKEAQLAYQSAQADFVNRKQELESAAAQPAGATSRGIEAQLQATRRSTSKPRRSCTRTASSRTIQAEAVAQRRRGAQEPAGDRTETARDADAPASSRSSRRRKRTSIRSAPPTSCACGSWTTCKVKAGMTGVLQLVPVERGAAGGAGHEPRARRRSRPTSRRNCGSRKPRPRTSASASTPKSTRATASSRARSSRIDPASTGGTVGVDVILEGALPSGARPDLSVDGTIQLETLDNVHLRRPPGVRPGEAAPSDCSS